MWPVFQYYSYKKSCIVSWLPSTQLYILNQKSAKIDKKPYIKIKSLSLLQKKYSYLMLPGDEIFQTLKFPIFFASFWFKMAHFALL